MCLFLGVTFNTSTWTYILVAVSLGAVIVGLYNQLSDIARDIQEGKNRTRNFLSIEKSLKQLHDEVTLLKLEVKDNLREVNSAQRNISLLKTDKTGMVDFAYKGEVVSIRNTETFEPEPEERARLGFRLCGKSYLEGRILESSVMPGDCWPIRGQEGAAVIALTREILVTRVTLEHAPRALLPGNTAQAAPRDFSLWGLRDHDGEPPHFFGQFRFNLNRAEVQTFYVMHSSNKTFNMVEFKVHSNHGHPDFTCVYRVRVHGRML